MACCRRVLRVWKTIVVISVPILALPIAFQQDSSKAMRALYGLTIMASYWITEALPLPVTAFLPAVIFPLLGVVPAKEIPQNYIKNASLFGFVCLAFSLCVEKWSLHRRIALRTILLMGSAPKWLMLGFMLPTWFLSLWVNNTSATAMMLPIVTAVLNNLRQIREAANDDVVDHVDLAEVANGERRREQQIKRIPIVPKNNGGPNDDELANRGDKNRGENESSEHMRKAMTICICYAASIGGIGSMSGSGTNVITQGQAEEFFRFYGLDSGVNFVSWFLCCLPIAVVCLLMAWAWLVCFFFGPRELLKWEWGDKEANQRTRRVIQKFLDEMGPMKFAEKAVLGHFILLIVLMLSMKLPGGGGWVNAFEDGYVKNAVPAVTVLVFAFLFPSQSPMQSQKNSAKRAPPLLEWGDVQKNLPWGTVILMGGGYALAYTIKDSGLSDWLGIQLSLISRDQHPWLIILVVSLCISFMTEVTSNATTASILCPILAQMAVSLNVHPLYFVFPGGLACSLAFMLPVATPPNTLVFATGHIKVTDMMKVGIFLNILCVGVVNLAINTWMSLYFGLDSFPPEMMTKTTATMMVMENLTYPSSHTTDSAVLTTAMMIGDDAQLMMQPSILPSIVQNVTTGLI